MNGGNPTTGADIGEVLKYPSGKVQPDPNYRGAAFDFGYNKSPNGMVEYKSNRFGGSLAGHLLVVRYSDDNDVVALDPNETDGKVPPSGWQSLPGVNQLKDPLDVIEDADGGLYVAEYDQLGNGPKITYMKPDESGTNPTGCSPVSTLTCAQVKVGGSHARSWDPRPTPATSRTPTVRAPASRWPSRTATARGPGTCRATSTSPAAA